MTIPRIAPTPRFGAWNSDPKRLTPAPGWKDLPMEPFNPGKHTCWGDPKTDDEIRERKTLHEVGHLLAAISLGQRHRVRHVVVDGDTSYVERDIPPHPSPKDLLNNVIITQAGEMSASLLQERPHVWDTSYPCVLEHVQEVMGLRDDYLQFSRLKQYLQPLFSSVPPVTRFFENLDAMTRAHLQQYSPKIIRELAELLSKEKHWDAARIRQLAKQYALENVPSLTQNTVPKENRFSLGMRLSWWFMKDIV